VIAEPALTHTWQRIGRDSADTPAAKVLMVHVRQRSPRTQKSMLTVGLLAGFYLSMWHFLWPGGSNVNQKRKARERTYDNLR
jgi:type II secretory pathway component PulM